MVVFLDAPTSLPLRKKPNPGTAEAKYRHEALIKDFFNHQCTRSRNCSVCVNKGRCIDSFGSVSHVKTSVDVLRKRGWKRDSTPGSRREALSQLLFEMLTVSDEGERFTTGAMECLFASRSFATSFLSTGECLMVVLILFLTEARICAARHP